MIRLADKLLHQISVMESEARSSTFSAEDGNRICLRLEELQNTIKIGTEGSNDKLLRDIFDELAGAEPVADDERLSYLTIQISRILWDRIQNNKR